MASSRQANFSTRFRCVDCTDCRDTHFTPFCYNGSSYGHSYSFHGLWTMSNRSFVHLHCHSHYSLLDGASRIPELVEQAKKQGMNAIALTDHGNLYGAIEFYRECKDAGLNPIIGYEAYVAPGKRTDREAKKRGEAGFHLTLLCKNAAGFRNLVKMASLAYLDGYYYVPRIDKELLEAHKEGVICLSGCA